MRGVAKLRSLRAIAVAVILFSTALGGCKTVEGGPDRLYSVSEEVLLAKAQLEGSKAPDVVGQVGEYYSIKGGSPEADASRIYLRNEIIARRMYIIDLEYTEYEAALTSERQKFGFGTSVAAQGLSVASALVTPLRSAQIVGGVASAVGASRGFYDSEIVVAKTIQIAQGHMRANRDIVAKRILPMRAVSSNLYPLSAAMRDLEDYYNAGTFTTGLIEALGQSGEAAKDAAIQKANVITGVFDLDDTTNILDRFLRPGGADAKLSRENLKLANACLPQIPGIKSVREILGDSSMVAYRQIVIRCLKL